MDGQTHTDGIYHASIVSRSKNVKNAVFPKPHGPIGQHWSPFP